ncbi:hypothetical protein LRP52_48485 [Photobacterium sp. ZSDE20]|nr:hypothetical protein [Photobacterium sp. ZSDE20]
MASQLFPDSIEYQKEFVSLSSILEEKMINDYHHKKRDEKTSREIYLNVIEQREICFKKRVEKLFKELDKRRLYESKLDQRLLLIIMYVFLSMDKNISLKHNVEPCRPRF